MMRRRTIAIVSLGCPRNLVDSEALAGYFHQKGYELVDINEAEIGLVNTCSFIEDAKKESIDAILELLELKKKGRLKKVIVAGCLPERYKDKLVGPLKEVDAFMGRVSLADGTFQPYRLGPAHYAYLKISEGCDHSCSFCILPKIKGRFCSRKPGEIYKEARRFDDEKKSELNIIGQDITLYGIDIRGKLLLAGLLKNILKNARHIHWLRLLYLHPQALTSELISLIGAQERICKYIDLPIQHISGGVLKRMNRRMSRRNICALIDKIRKTIPDAAIRTSLIVGFPGETEKEFRELESFVKEQRFQRLGVFRYSREEGTAAYNFARQIPARLKQERFKRIMSLQQKISAEFNRGFLGKTLEVLIDEKDSPGIYLGRSSIDAPEIDGSVYVKSDKGLKAGDFVKVRITDAYEYDLAGEAV